MLIGVMMNQIVAIVAEPGQIFKFIIPVIMVEVVYCKDSLVDRFTESANFCLLRFFKNIPIMPASSVYPVGMSFPDVDY